MDGYAEESEPIWGQWQLSGASVQFPESCKSLFYWYRRDGSLEAHDGKLIMTGTYTVTKVSKGLFLHSSYVSDNGQPNCQGLSAEFVRQNNVSRVLVQFAGGPDKLRIYFGESDDLPFIVLTRTK